jgi:methionine-rich copper-binding protein CopC
MPHTLVRAIVLAGIVTTASVPLAQSHAFLDHAQPAVGSTVAAAPSELRLWFTEALEPAFSTVSVTDAQGKPVAQQKATVAASDPKLLELALPPLPPGDYKVMWRVVSVDTHRTQGSFGFTIAP